MDIKYLKTSDLIPYSKNAKKHPEDQVEHIANSIKTFGFQQPIVVDQDNVVVIGHGRLLAAKKLRLDTVPCVVLSELSEEEIKALRLADNKTNESEWDLDFLDDELAEIFDIDMSDFGFDFDSGADFFDREEKDGAAREEGNEEYNEFLDKFDPKKTTDDCYTPDLVYDAVVEWVVEEYGVKQEDFVRPFYPGGDYQAFKYKDNAIVVDNPPFSILAEILNFYDERKIKFFLFAPALTLFSSSSSSCAIAVGVGIVYENNANVSTSFLTNLEEDRIRTAPTLYNAVQKAVEEVRRQTVAELPKYKYPDEVVTSAQLSFLSKYGFDFRASKSETAHIRALDEQKAIDKGIFGSGYLLSRKAAQEKAAQEKAAQEKAAQEKAAQEKAAQEKAAAQTFNLSEREKAIVESLG
jgi:hypothetical protein